MTWLDDLVVSFIAGFLLMLIFLIIDSVVFYCCGYDDWLIKGFVIYFVKSFGLSSLFYYRERQQSKLFEECSVS